MDKYNCKTYVNDFGGRVQENSLHHELTSSEKLIGVIDTMTICGLMFDDGHCTEREIKTTKTKCDYMYMYILSYIHMWYI